LHIDWPGVMVSLDWEHSDVGVWSESIFDGVSDVVGVVDDLVPRVIPNIVS